MAETILHHSAQLGFWVCLLWLWAGGTYYYGLLLGEATVQALKRGIGDVPLTENSQMGPLAWFPIRVRL